jgi:HEAT repeat protein
MKGRGSIGAVAAVVLALAPASSPGQQIDFDEVIGNLQHTDAKVRLTAVRLLRESGYPEAIGPIAALVLDPDDDVQFEAIGAQLSFFMPEPIPARRRVGLVVERRSRSAAETAFEMGAHAALPRPVPPGLAAGLIQAIQDENPGVRFEAAYALGVIVRPPLAPGDAPALIDALDHADPANRPPAGARRGRRADRRHERPRGARAARSHARPRRHR